MLGSETSEEDVTSEADWDEEDDDQDEPAPPGHAGRCVSLAMPLWADRGHYLKDKNGCTVRSSERSGILFPTKLTLVWNQAEAEDTRMVRSAILATTCGYNV